MAKFEVVSRFADAGIAIPVHATKNSAGYDLAAAEDIVIPSYGVMERIMAEEAADMFANEDGHDFVIRPLTLSEMAALTKRTKAKPTLVSTGLKCKLDPGTYLQLAVRSSTPLKYWLILANSIGVIDADYYNNPDNEGEIFLQMINLSPYDIKIQKGEAIGQAIIVPYLNTEDSTAAGERLGGFGSTSR
jgi:dUTP pyrophosphatase